MAKGTIESNNAKVLAEANANQTYAAQIASIKTAFTALDISNRVRCKILLGTQIYNVVSSAGIFTRMVQGKANTIQWYGGLIDMADNTYYKLNNATSSNESNTINTDSMQLIII